MHVISVRPFKEGALKYPNHANALMDVYRVLSRDSVKFKTPEEMRCVFSSLDNLKYKDTYYVINVAGNHLRIIMAIIFKTGTIFIKHIVTHAEYDKLVERYRRGDL